MTLRRTILALAGLLLAVAMGMLLGHLMYRTGLAPW